MKLLYCKSCGDVRAPEPEGMWTTCWCGNLSVRWVNPRIGTLEVRARVRADARVIGMNNVFLSEDVTDPDGSVRPCQNDGDWKSLHDQATNAAGYIFDKGQRACWACIFRVGQTADVKWADEPSGAAAE